MVKKALSLLLVVVMLFSFSGCVYDVVGSALFLYLIATGDDRADKEDIFDFVCENEEELLKAIKKSDFSKFKNKGFIKEINADDLVVEFPCGGFGVGSGTSYVGFYYTPNDDMTAPWCAASGNLTRSGDGYEWKEPNGDNYYYTENICGKFYYYEASF